VIKTDNYLTKDGVYIKGRSFFAKDEDEAAKVLHELEDLETRIIAQEMIPGSGVGAFLLRFGGKTHLKFAHRRLHEIPYTGGYSSYRESMKDNDLITLGESILTAIGYEGVAMVEFRRSSLDDRAYFMEINGRLWGSLALALHAGIDFPKALVECYTGGCSSERPPEYRSGVRCINSPGELEHLISILQAKPIMGMKPPPKSSKAIIKSLLLLLNPMIRHDHFWWTDPLPGIKQAANTMSFLGAKLIKKIFQVCREGLMLKKVSLRHKVLCSQPRYFQHSLKKILFVCEGNICRSPFAEHYWNGRIKELSLAGPKAISAGFNKRTGRKTPPWITAVVKEYSIDLDNHRSCKLTRDIIDSADAIFIMHRNNYRDLLSEFPGAECKVYYLGLFADNGKIEIDDPYNKDKDDAQRCYKQLVRSLDGLIKKSLER
jgi:protein-tyrosine-phosphatase